jgi:hypothetical protein
MNINGVNISIDLSLFIQVTAFIIFILVMWKSNKNGFKTLEDSSKSGFKEVDLKFNNLIAILALERDGVKKDLEDLDCEVKGIKAQFKGEIYPRLNTAERKIDKNCRALQDFEKFCNERHKNLKPKET